jgi:hypothetical protein
MKFHQSFNEMAIRPYGRGYQAPSTALFNTDRAVVSVGGGSDSIHTLEVVKVPDVLEIVVNIVLIPLPIAQNYTASYQFDNVTWPSVPLYPAIETQFISALKLSYADQVKVRDKDQYESVIFRGNTISGFEIALGEEGMLYTHQFDYVNQSISFHVIKKRTLVPVWPVGGFYRPGCQIDQIQQVFCSLAEQNQETFARKTLLHQWNDQGTYLPQSTQKDDQQTDFQTARQDIYIKFIDVIRQGDVLLTLVEPTENKKLEKPFFSYKSVDMTIQGLTQAVIHFIKI